MTNRVGAAFDFLGAAYRAALVIVLLGGGLWLLNGMYRSLLIEPGETVEELCGNVAELRDLIAESAERKGMETPRITPLEAMKSTCDRKGLLPT